MSKKPNSRKNVLISGASMAGLTLVYWLSKYGFDVTVVERTETVRKGGYPIDVRGAAVDVAERMGILPQLQNADIQTEKITFINPSGTIAGTISSGDDTGGVNRRDIELSRGSLTKALLDLTKHQPIRYQFGDAISTLDDNGTSVDVHFKSGKHGKFDLVIGADGLHSNTRRLVFGEERPFIRYLGYCFSGFTISNDLGLSHEAVIFATPGRTAALYAAGKSNTLHAILMFTSKEAPYTDNYNTDKQRRLTVEKFAGLGWKIPYLMKEMQKANDLYYDVVSQIHMSRWSAGRVALVGDSAFAPSFMSGQGSSLALVGAYILAGELASHQEYEKAFAAYENIMRPFTEANQKLVGSRDSSLLFPSTSDEIEARNQALTALQSEQKSMLSHESKDAHNLLSLPEY